MIEQNQNEIEMIQASLRGQSQAFGCLVQEYQALVCAITYSATGNADHSEELAQEVFLKAWKNLAQLRDLTKFKSWLCRIARTTVQNWFRSRQKDTVTQAASLDAAYQISCPGADPAETSSRREREALVHQGLSQLSESQRVPLILFYREQQSTAEVARQLNLTENAARQQIYRARQALRDQMLTLIEHTLEDTRPSKAFASGVVTAITALSLKTATVSAAGGIASVSTGISSLGVKLGLIAAGFVIVAGGWMVANRFRTSDMTVSPRAEAATPIVSPEPDQVPVTNQRLPQVLTSQPMTPDDTSEVGQASLPPVNVLETTAISEPYRYHPAGVLSGLITDAETGVPIENAEIQLHKSRRIFGAFTDANGFYSIADIHEAGSYEVHIDPPPAYIGYAWSSDNPLVHLEPKQQASKHFVLPHACQVSLTVVDINGVGISKAKVVATSLVEPHPKIVGYFGRERTTDPNGFLDYGGFRPADTDYLITVFHDQLFYREYEGQTVGFYRRDYARGKAIVRLTDPNQITDVVVVLEKGESIHGYLEYADGVPAADVEIETEPDWWHSSRGETRYTPNQDGTFTIQHVTPGTYNIRVHYPRAEGGDGSIRTVMQTDLPLADGEPLIVILPQNSPGSLASITGTLQFEGGKVPDSISVTALNLTTHKQTHTSLVRNPDKTFPQTFTMNNLQPGDYLLRLYAGELFEDKIIQKLTVPCSDLQVEIKYLNTGLPKLMGKVLSVTTGEPIQHFLIRSFWQSGLDQLNNPQWTEINHPQGLFSWDVQQRGIYRVQVVAHGYASAWSEDIDSQSGVPTAINLSVGGALKGTVVNESGQTIADAKVIPLSLASGTSIETTHSFASDYGAATTDQDGRFTLENLAPGLETLKVVYPGQAFSVVDNIEIIAGKITQAKPVVLRPGGSVAGIVYDEKGIPQAGQVIQIRLDNEFIDYFKPPLADVITDSNGFYDFEHLPLLPCVVHRTMFKMNGVIVQNLVPKNKKVHVLDFGGTPLVSGSILIDNQVLINHKLRLDAPQGHLRGDFTYFAQTNELGDFTLRGIPAGPHTIYYAHPVQEGQWIELTTFEMGTENLDLGIISKKGLTGIEHPQ